jgi:hypothetical protein
MVIDVAFDTFQLKVDELPAVTPEGLAVKVTTGRLVDGGVAGVPATMIWQVAVILPEALVAVRV